MQDEMNEITVTTMSAEDQMIKFCLDNNVQRTVVDELLDRGFDSLTALSLVDAEDLKSQRIPVGQRRLILHISKSLGGNQGTETTVAASASGSNKTGSEEQVAREQPDLYQQTLLDSLMAQQAQMTGTNTNGPHNLISPSPVLTNMTKESSQPSWQDPQVHIATATGKSSSAYYDICDFVPKAVEEEVVIGGQGEQQIVVKAGPKKPKLENLTLSQWSVANLAILYKLVADGKLKDESLMDYLSYSTKIYQLVQKCSLASVLLYDREYRQLQANMSFRWGTDVQHLHTLHLHFREKLVTQGPNSTNQRRGTFESQGPKKGARQGVDICRSYNAAKGCSFARCKFKHICIVPGCNKPHPVTSHTFEKN